MEEAAAEVEESRGMTDVEIMTRHMERTALMEAGHSIGFMTLVPIAPPPLPPNVVSFAAKRGELLRRRSREPDHGRL
jgi:hypothetical protein